MAGGAPQQMGQPMQQGPTCPNGHPIDPSWEVCPYCRQAAQQGMAPAAVQAGAGGGVAMAGKTMAIDVKDVVGEHANKAVVGWIVCMDGSQKGQDFRLFDGRNVLGTAADCDIVIFDPYLSARHAVILIESKSSKYTIQDLDSRNGTYVNRQRVQKQELYDNDTVRLASTDFRFKCLY
jgi:hypothetical protein